MAAALSPQCRYSSKFHRVSSSSDESPSPAQSRVEIPLRKSPRNFALRTSKTSSSSSTATAVVATADAPSTTPPTIEDRKKLVQEQQEKEQTPFLVTVVDVAEVKDFYPAPLLSVADVAPGVRCITVQAEVSREFVSLDKAYTKPGQSVRVRIPGREEGELVAASSAPFSGQTNWGVLYKLRGDISAGSTKAAQYAISVRAPLDLHVEEAAHPLLFHLQPGDTVEVGQFQANGMDLRPVMFLSRFPTLLIFANGPGAGIAVARALVEAEDVGSLYTQLRADVRLYYAVPSPAHLAYQEWFPLWKKLNVQVKPVVSSASAEWEGFVGGFANAFEEDDLEYDPDTTAAVVCGDAASNKAALAVLEEAGIPRAHIISWQH